MDFQRVTTYADGSKDTVDLQTKCKQKGHK